MVKSVEELYEAIRENKYEVTTMEGSLEFRRKYKKGHVFDDNKSIKWNREEVEKQNKKVDDERAMYRELSRKKEKEFKQDIITAYATGLGLTEEQVGLVFNKAYGDHHSSGMYEVIEELDELLELIMRFNSI